MLYICGAFVTIKLHLNNFIMETFIIQDQNKVYNTSAQHTNLFKPTYKNILNLIKTKASDFIYRIIYVLRPHNTHSVIKIENLHQSYKKLDQPSKQIFFLYAKGYSLDEISNQSGIKHDKILIIIHDFVKSLTKDDSIS